MSGKLFDLCRSFWINVDAECIIILDVEAPIGFPLEANGKQNIIGLPFRKFTIETTIITNLSFIAGIYPFPINITSIEHYEGNVPINYAMNAIGVNEIVITLPLPITSFYFVIGVAPCRIGYDRPAVVTDPLMLVGAAINLPLKVNNTIQAIGVGGLTTFNGWGLY